MSQEQTRIDYNDRLYLEKIRSIDGIRRYKLFDNDIEGCNRCSDDILNIIKKIKLSEHIDEANNIEKRFNEYRERFRYPNKFQWLVIKAKLWFFHHIYGDPNIRYTPSGFAHCDNFEDD